MLETSVWDDPFEEYTKAEDISDERRKEIVEVGNPQELNKLAEDIESKTRSEKETDLNEAISKADELILTPPKTKPTKKKPVQLEISGLGKPTFKEGKEYLKPTGKEETTTPLFQQPTEAKGQEKLFEGEATTEIDQQQTEADELLSAMGGQSPMKTGTAVEANAKAFFEDAVIAENTDLFLEPEEVIIIDTKQNWIKNSKYDPEVNNLYLLKPGDEGFVEGQEIYRGIAKGSTIQPDRTTGRRGKVKLYGSKEMADLVEESIHVFQAEVVWRTPRLAEKIRKWETEARRLATEYGYDKKLPLEKELFAKSFVKQAGYKIDEETMPIWKGVFDETVAMLNESKSGEAVYHKYLKPQALNQTAPKKLGTPPDTKPTKKNQNNFV